MKNKYFSFFLHPFLKSGSEKSNQNSHDIVKTIFPFFSFFALKNLNKAALMLALVFVSLTVSAQQEQRFWIFGNTPGSTLIPSNIEFPGGAGAPVRMSPEPVLNTNGVFGAEGTAVVTDPYTGELLFYTDGRFVYDDNHQLLDIDPNVPGFEQLGANPSSTQPAAVCVVPQCPFNEYYIFSNPTGTGVVNGDGPVAYRRYNTVNQSFSQQLSMPGPYGNENTAEGLIVIPSRTDPFLFWVIFRLQRYQDIVGDGVRDEIAHVVYRIDPSGISFHDVFSFGPVLDPNARYLMNIAYTSAKFPNDPDNVEVGFAAHLGRNLYTITFNSTTGNFDVPSAVNIDHNITSGVLYDLEYSPDGSKLYYATYGPPAIYQLDFNSPNNGGVRVNTFSGVRGGGLKLGPDNRIYFVQAGGDPTTPGMIIGRLNTPNEPFTTSTVLNDFYTGNILSFPHATGYNLPEFVRMPLWNASVTVTGDEKICPGESITLNSTIITLGVGVSSYQWFQNGNAIPGENTSSLVVTEAGEYFLEIQLVGGCSIRSRIIVIRNEANVCLCNISLGIDQNVAISENTVWEGRVSIADHVTVTVNSVLDITNVDVVFGECSRIVFTSKGSLRANNSVFRPCDPNSTWGGLIFDGSKNHRINECTFKNAVTANYFINNADATISNNLYQNNYVGVLIQEASFNKSITGNHFEKNNDIPFTSKTFACADLIPSTVVHSFLFLNKADLTVPIAQNSFTDNFQNALLQIIGVYVTDIQGMQMIQNDFSNVLRPGFMYNTTANSKEVIFSDNIINMNSSKHTQHVFYAYGFTNLTVSGNTITNSLTAVKNNIPWYGYYLSSNKELNFKNNSISGTRNGLRLFGCANSQVIENNIKNVYEMAISTYYGENLNISCNSIDMNDLNGKQAQSIGIYSYNTRGEFVKFHSNCITDCSNPINIRSIHSSYPFPVIYNNFMYNYSKYGVYATNVSGSIGTATVSGLNTFWSNKHSAVDVGVANGNISLYNNFGVFNISSGVNIVQNNPYHSTASCAKQIFNMPSQGNLDVNLKCDEKDYIYSLNTSPAVLKIGSADDDEPVYDSNINTVRVDNRKMTVYPNPAKDYLTIQLLTMDEVINNTSVKLMDMTGKVVKEFSPNIVAGELQINVSDLDPGLYMIQFITNSGESLKSVFVKQ